MEEESALRNVVQRKENVSVEGQDETNGCVDKKLSLVETGESCWKVSISLSSLDSDSQDDDDDDDDDSSDVGDDEETNVEDELSLTDSWLSDDINVILLQRLRNKDIDDDSEARSLTTIEEQDTRVPEECQVCFDVVKLNRRPCCRLPVCRHCLESYVQIKLVSEGVVHIGCPNPACDRAMYQDQVRELLRWSTELRDRYERWLVDINAEAHRKTCPRCCHITQLELSQLKGRSIAKRGLPVQCSECQFQWCFQCQAPWHDGLTCKTSQREDRVQLKNWAEQRATERDEYNARRCPKCKVLALIFHLYVS